MQVLSKMEKIKIKQIRLSGNAVQTGLSDSRAGCVKEDFKARFRERLARETPAYLLNEAIKSIQLQQ